MESSLPSFHPSSTLRSPSSFSSLSSSPTLQTSFAPLISDWDQLALSVQTANDFDVGETIFIRSGSILFVRDPIRIQTNSIVIQCGVVGVQENNCVIFGGVSNFIIEGNTTGTEFRGLTFIGVEGISVIAAGTAQANALFVDCKWNVSFDFPLSFSFRLSLFCLCLI